MTAEASAPESRAFEADVAKLLHLMVHSVYSEKDVFLRELISNAADACEKLRYEAIGTPELLGGDAKARITIALDAEAGTLAVEDNGIGMTADEMVEALGTIARSGTKAFLERIEAAKAQDAGESKAGAQLIGQFGVGFYSAFMVADRVEVISRRAGTDAATRWSSDGQGAYTIEAASAQTAPERGTRVTLHLLADAKTYTDRYKIENLVRTQSGHVPVPISVIDKPGAEPEEIVDGAALWTRSKSEIGPEEYADFYKSVSYNLDEPALIVHMRAEGRHEYTALVFVPSARPFDLFDADRKGRVKLYVKRVFITADADILPRYLRFVRGIVDSADLPLNISREMIQESTLLKAVGKGVTGRVLGDLEKLAESDKEAYTKIWDTFGSVLKEGLYEDFERREQLLGLARFKTTAAPGEWRTLKEYTAALRPNQTAVYYIAGDDQARLEASPQLEGFRARGVEVLLLAEPIDSFWVTAAPDVEGKPFKSVTQGGADLALVPLLDEAHQPAAAASEPVTRFITFVKETLGDVVADVRASDRLTDSMVCLTAPEHGPDRQLEKLLAGAGQLKSEVKPILEINPGHELVAALAALGEDEADFRRDAARILLDEARILDGVPPADTRGFSDRLGRLIRRGLS
ncbi:molecular chaperone HtpG [Chelatococcus reniformis]|uniref:Chaperone protein HtpG n=1 Tax=Chelatococcus reniformis TaxID=1494448 RepID=A0A916TXF8_9HYPH|nr:molecular chaperone HtpG [Chelatococcus reniformis]GGC50821.1 chaperone protein HtpG [Chelatococcus reniformis]